MKVKLFYALALGLLVSCSDDDKKEIVPPIELPEIEKITLSNGETFDGKIEMEVGQENPVTITLACKNVDTYQWTLDGKVDADVTGNTYTFSNTEWSGKHELAVSLGNTQTSEKLDSTIVINVKGEYAGKILAIMADGETTVYDGSDGSYQVFADDKEFVGDWSTNGQLQMACLFGNDLYCVSTGKDFPMAVIDPQTLKVKRKIAAGDATDKETFPSCGTTYTVSKVNDKKAYIICATSATLGGFRVVDLETGKIVKHQVVAKNIAEKMICLDDSRVLGVASDRLYTVNPETDVVTDVPVTIGENRFIVGIAFNGDNTVYVAVSAEVQGSGYSSSFVSGSNAKIICLDAKTLKATGKEYELSGVFLNANSYMGGLSGLCYINGYLCFYGKTSLSYGGSANIYRYDLEKEELVTIETGGSIEQGLLYISSDAQSAFAMQFANYMYYECYRYDFATQSKMEKIFRSGSSSQAPGAVVDLR